MITAKSTHAVKLENQSGRKPIGPTLDVECWCRRKVVPVLRARVLKCMTNSCGRPECRPTTTPWEI